MLVCPMPEGALANLWVSFAASDRTSDPWTVLYKVFGTKGGANFTWNDTLVDDDGGPAGKSPIMWTASTRSFRISSRS